RWHLRRFLHLSVSQLARRALGFAGVAEELAFETVETWGGGEEAVAPLRANDDTCGLRIDFDDVAVRHGPWIPQCGQTTTLSPKGSWAFEAVSTPNRQAIGYAGTSSVL